MAKFIEIKEVVVKPGDAIIFRDWNKSVNENLTRRRINCGEQSCGYYEGSEESSEKSQVEKAD